MKAIMIVDLDDSFIPLDEDSITLEKGTIKYRDINRNPFEITIEGLKLKPMPEKVETPKIIQEQIDGWHKLAGEYIGYNACIDELLGETE